MKRTLSFLLIFVMLLSVVPMTALTTAAVTSGEIAETGETYGVSTGEALFAMLEKDTPEGDVMTINVNADISYYVTKEGDSGLDSYLRYACTVGKGKKILNLNGHKLHFYNDYSVIDACNGYSVNILNNLNRQCLFAIPDGADLTVNGDAPGKVDSGLLQYHGKLLYKCDAIDQRDLFEIRGGSLTVNSGAYYAGGESTSYEWSVSMDILPGIYVPTGRKGWYLVSGTAIRALSGSLTVNGGYFEGRGLKGYSQNRNCALYADSSMRSVVINDGHFKGRSAANVLDVENAENAGKLTVNAGLFELEHSDAVICVVYRSYDNATSSPGVQGLYFREPNPNTVYYYKETSKSGFIEASQSSLKSDQLAFFRHSTAFQVYVDPKQGHRVDAGVSIEPTSELGFLIEGKKYTSSDSVNWRVGSALWVFIDPDQLYFKDQDAEDYGVSQTMNDAMQFDLLEYISDSNQPVVLSSQTIDLYRQDDAYSSGKYYFDLNTLSSAVKSKLENGHTYCFVFTATEKWKSRREFSIWHTGRFYVTIGQKVKQLSCIINAPQYGQHPSTDVTTGVSGDFSEINLVSWTYRASASDSWHSMSSTDSFNRDNIYSANFMVNMKSGCTLEDGAEFYVNGEKAMITYQNEGGCIAQMEYDMRMTPIRVVRLNDVPEPISGEYAMRSYTIPEGANYAVKTQLGGGYQMYWYKENGATLKPTDTFESGKDYKLRVVIESTNNYRFSDSPLVYFNDRKAELKSNFDNKELTAEYTFTCPISAAEISSVSATVALPAAGEKPSYSASIPSGFGYSIEDYNTKFWSGGVMWYDKDNKKYIDANAPDAFAAGGHYEVTISLMIDDEALYKFVGSDELTATIDDLEADVIDYDEGVNIYITRTFTVAGESGGYIVGDVNLSGAVDNRDAMILDRYVAEWPGYDAYIKNMDAADMDRKGTVDNRDAMILDRVVAGWPGYYEKYCITV